MWQYNVLDTFYGIFNNLNQVIKLAFFNTRVDVKIPRVAVESVRQFIILHLAITSPTHKCRRN